jgi:hypothetical protein
MSSVQRNAISAPATGLMVFDNTTNSFWYRVNSTWREVKNDSMNAAFSAFIPSSSQSTSPGTTIFVNFPSEEFDDGGNNYNVTNSQYTVPSSGVYEFSATVGISINSSGASPISYTLTVYESVGFTVHTVGTSTVVVAAGYVGGINLSTSGTVKLTAGTGGIVRATITASPGSFAQPIATGKFSGHRVY